MSYILSFIIFIPLAGAFLLLFIPGNQVKLIKRFTLIVTTVQFLSVLVLFISFQKTAPASFLDSFQYLERYEWITLGLGDSLQFVIEYHVGVDGISLPLVVLTSLIMLVAVASSWQMRRQVKGYFILFNLLNTSIVGCFLALDFFLFYLFFELMLLPMFFMIGIWGGPRRSYAAIKFFIYTLFGSLLILIVMIVLYLGVSLPGQDVHTFNLLLMMDGQYFDGDSVLNPLNQEFFLGYPARYVAFLALFIGFAIKLPMVPFHTWLPDAHVEAPTPISVILAALLLKVGGYGIIRIGYGIFPDAGLDLSYVVGTFGVISIIYGGMNALAQRDIKRMIAYSSVSHMGFVLVGIAAMTSEGLSGAVFQMVSHGLISAALFLIAGVIYDRTGDRLIENYSGLASQLPGYTFVVVLVFFASLGLPGLSGFVGEVLVLMGAFDAAYGTDRIPFWIAMVSVSGILISAIYFLWTIQRMFFGSYWVRHSEWSPGMVDLNRREWVMFIPLIVFILVLGVYPRLILDMMEGTIVQFVDHVLSYGRPN